MNRKFITLIVAVLVIILMPMCASANEKLYAVSPDGEISLRIAPDEQFFEITKIPACSKVELIETEKTWGKVIFNNKCGWINLSFTASSYNNAAEATGRDFVKNVSVDAKSGSTKLYSVPTSDEKLGSTVTATIPNSTILSIKRETSNGWGLVSMNKKYAWVRMSDTKKYGTYGEENAEEYGIFYVYVTSRSGTGAPLYKNKGGAQIANIPDCVRLTIREKSGNYGYTSYNGINGWVNLKLTTDSYSNALTNTGEAVNEEYDVVISDNEIDMMNIPSYDVESGTYAVESLENGETVFILRQTTSGWSMLSKNGVRGWIPTEYLEEATENRVELPEMCQPYDIYILTKESKGIKLYTEPDSQEDSICTIPECARMTVIAKSGESIFVKNDYAAGWTKDREFASSYEKAAASNKLEKPLYYRIEDETTLRTLPIYAELCGSEELLTVPVGKEFKVTKIVTTGDRKWGLTEIDSQTGWINLNCADKSISNAAKLIIVLLIAFILVLIVLIFRKIKGRRK